MMSDCGMLLLGSQPLFGSQSGLPYDRESPRPPMDEGFGDPQGYEPRMEGVVPLGAPGNGFDPDRSLPNDGFEPDGRRPFDPEGQPSFLGPDGGIPADFDRSSLDSQNRGKTSVDFTRFHVHVVWCWEKYSTLALESYAYGFSMLV